MGFFDKIDEKFNNDHDAHDYAHGEYGGDRQFYEEAHQEGNQIYQNNQHNPTLDQARGFFDKLKGNNGEEQADVHDHKAHFTHEAIGAAAAWEAVSAWNKHQERTGQKVEHGTAKKAVAGLAMGTAIKLFEDHGIDWIEKKRAAAHASAAAQKYYDETQENKGY
ncbi:hypothetical protein H4219_002876 [Mycoemilia scoparia]|uniref:Uncharacterized protein n=1 Tax=Mycoemilia scoparia TaxID=417184 RepID=A0A9W8A5R6_9FUNG|nr:hypothetical protein H4219_002876 [Mycoemilia scoparia]